MVTDKQVRRLFALIKTEENQEIAASKAGMDAKTARKYRRLGRLPSELPAAVRGRTRPDPFIDVWDDVQKLFEDNAGPEAKTLLEALQRQHPGHFADGQLRTLQRQVKRWRGLEGPGPGGILRPGASARSAGPVGLFAHDQAGRDLGGAEFSAPDLSLRADVLELGGVTLCYTESFESLSEGLQNALWELGGVPQRHRTDCFDGGHQHQQPRGVHPALPGAAAYYDLRAEKTNPDSGHENGDVEQRHHRFKRAVDQALMLRGSRDFADVAAYGLFLKRCWSDSTGPAGTLHRGTPCCGGLPPVGWRRSSASG